VTRVRLPREVHMVRFPGEVIEPCKSISDQ
jgi:hypothetical protein